jgi:hypothetical protein
MNFLRRHWVWIVAPIFVVAAAVLLVAWLGQEPEVAPFDYSGG